MSKAKILKIINELQEVVQDEYNENIETEDFGSYASCEGFNEIIENFLRDVGRQLENKELAEMFKKPLSMREIVQQVKIDNLYDFEELEEVHIIEEEDSRGGDRYLYKTIIFNHKPSNTNYGFTLQMSHDRSVDLDLQYDGQVEEKKITTTQWVKFQQK